MGAEWSEIPGAIWVVAAGYFLRHSAGYWRAVAAWMGSSPTGPSADKGKTIVAVSMGLTILANQM